MYRGLMPQPPGWPISWQLISYCQCYHRHVYAAGHHAIFVLRAAQKCSKRSAWSSVESEIDNMGTHVWLVQAAQIDV